MDKITNEKLDRYFTITNKALKKVKIVKTGEIDFEKAAKDFLDMAQRYYDDAKHFRDKKDYINALPTLRDQQRRKKHERLYFCYWRFRHA